MLVKLKKENKNKKFFLELENLINIFFNRYSIYDFNLQN